jgi:energy-coupling factor transporter ATP-binding protein EcfA2
LRRVRLPFAPGLEVEFTDRERALGQVYELADRGTRLPVVVFGPEGCGKTSLLLQATEILKEMDYSVIYFNPLRRRFEVEVGVESVRRVILDRLRQVSTELEFAKLIWLVIDVAVEVLKHGRRRLAVVVDDAFQFMGVREAAALIKGLLEIIEHPEESYERIVAIAATSEGLSRAEIGRHLWAWIMPMWNMSREGFEELYKLLPEPKPGFDDVWRLTGGNPRVLSMLYQARWSVDKVVNSITTSKRLDAFVLSLSAEERKWLLEAAENPDTLLAKERLPLINKLVELNLVVDSITYRDPELWVDQPPPQKDLELGIGKYIAWQTPLYREAVRKALEEATAA